ncbi:hypothetical protein MAL08_19075 [Leptospira noguchii]|uniref:hypothetical protein n=1 Tax=Leptospira noguchii TaxID=28182 RepID=UPI001FB7CF9E|nr:hypothetical protein [Leptospira noguchii]UOG39947.1 hypothetical protein MAL08_19075 [Leptospira noguchii]
MKPFALHALNEIEYSGIILPLRNACSHFRKRASDSVLEFHSIPSVMSHNILKKFNLSWWQKTIPVTRCYANAATAQTI